MHILRSWQNHKEEDLQFRFLYIIRIPVSQLKSEKCGFHTVKYGTQGPISMSQWTCNPVQIQVVSQMHYPGDVIQETSITNTDGNRHLLSHINDMMLLVSILSVIKIYNLSLMFYHRPKCCIFIFIFIIYYGNPNASDSSHDFAFLEHKNTFFRCYKAFHWFLLYSSMYVGQILYNIQRKDELFHPSLE